MNRKTSRYDSRPKKTAPSNPIVLNARSASWLFWSMVTIIAVMIVGATYWLLTHPITA